jgi:hypothetical protein
MNKNPYRNTEKYKAARREYCRKYYYDKYQKKQVANNHRCRSNNQKWLKNHKLNLSCCLCGESNIHCLDFHHLDKSTKHFNLANATSRGFGKERILAEIAKCQVLCSNCHRKLHGQERDQFSSQIFKPQTVEQTQLIQSACLHVPISISDFLQLVNNFFLTSRRCAIRLKGLFVC